MEYTIEELKAMEDKYGNLDLSGTDVTVLPNTLTVGGSLDLRGTKITTLPDTLKMKGMMKTRMGTM